METTIDVDKFDLENTFMSSFASYLFEQRKVGNTSKWVGLVDPVKRLELSQSGNQLVLRTVEDKSDAIDYASRYITGLWHIPQVSAIESRSREIVERLSQNVIPGVRVPLLFKNKWHVLLSAMLSIHARTDLSRLWFTDLNKMRIDYSTVQSPSDVSKTIKDRVGKSPGFRIRYIVEMARDLNRTYTNCPDPLEYVSALPPPLLRRELLAIDNIGPKVCDCFLLNAVGDIEAPPVDIHVKRVSEYLGIIPPNIGYPTPGYCIHYTCSEESSRLYGIEFCPKAAKTLKYLEDLDSASGTCVRSALTRSFKNAGWVQALLFLFGKKFCVWRPRRGPLCDTCPLSEYCSAKGKLTWGFHEGPYRRPRRPETASLVKYNEPHLFKLFPTEGKKVNDDSEMILARARALGVAPKHENKLARAACILIACREEGLPVISKELCQEWRIEVRNLLRVASKIRAALGMKFRLTTPLAYCERVRREFNIPEHVLVMAAKIIEQNNNCQNAIPAAAAGICVAARILRFQITERDIARALMISEVTVRSAVKKVDLF